MRLHVDIFRSQSFIWENNSMCEPLLQSFNNLIVSKSAEIRKENSNVSIKTNFYGDDFDAAVLLIFY